jgi:biopolymer transport protein ExbD
MRFAAPRRRPPGESIVAMINVVFLLLVFFLMTARLAPPEPLEVTPPESATEGTAEGEVVLFLAADGALAFGTARGEAALAALAAALAEASGTAVLLRADAAAPARAVAALLPRLAALGAGEVRLVTRGRADGPAR